MQEAILAGWKNLPRLRDGTYFTTWLTRITINTAINMTRKRRDGAPLLMELPARGEKSDERLDIRRAIESLDQKTRICTVLYYFEDMPTAPDCAGDRHAGGNGPDPAVPRQGEAEGRIGGLRP